MTQICKVHAKSDLNGQFHIDLPGFASGLDANLTVIVETETEQIAGKSLSKGRFTQFCGAIAVNGDPVTIQKELRSEW